MSACFGLLPVGLLVGLIVSIANAWQRGHGASERWGTVRQPVDGGAGAYRAGPVSGFVPRGVPASVWLAGIGGAAGAITTSLLFAPIGLLFGLLMYHDSPATRAVGVVTLVVALSGLALGIGLHFASRALLSCERGAWRTARKVAVWSTLHHLALVVTYGLAALESGEEAAWWVVGVASIGLVHAGVLEAAAQRTRTIQEALSADEWDALPSAEGDGVVEEPRVVGLLEGLEGRLPTRESWEE